MGELLGIPEWLVFCLSIWLAIAAIFGRRAHKRLARKRANPTCEEFIAMMGADIDDAVTAWLWGQLVFYYRPLTPHPDDHLIDDVRIDDDDIGMDWPREWAESAGLTESGLPQWPDGWSLTVRNYARWLQLSLARPA